MTQWQKAQQQRPANNPIDDYRGYRGQLFWVSGVVGSYYETNVVDDAGRTMMIDRVLVELLPEFTDAPGQIQWADFIRREKAL